MNEQKQTQNTKPKTTNERNTDKRLKDKNHIKTACKLTSLRTIKSSVQRKRFPKHTSLTTEPRHTDT